MAAPGQSLVPPLSASVAADGGPAVVLDYGNLLAPQLETRLVEGIKALEDSSPWRLRILTTYNQENMPSFRALQDYWSADSKTIIMSWDEYRGNVLEFYYSDSIHSTVPRNVFQELRGRFGNKYFISEEGTEQAVETVTQKLEDCLSQGGCTFVPGLSQQQREFSLVPVTSGAFLAGAALRNKASKWTYLFLFIWVPWIVGFGFYPLYIRQPEDVTPLLQNVGIFAVLFSLTYLTPLFGQVRLPGQRPDEEP